MVHGKLNNQTPNKHTYTAQKQAVVRNTGFFNQNGLNNHSFSLFLRIFVLRLCEVCIKTGCHAHFLNIHKWRAKIKRNTFN